MDEWAHIPKEATMKKIRTIGVAALSLALAFALAACSGGTYPTEGKNSYAATEEAPTNSWSGGTDDYYEPDAYDDYDLDPEGSESITGTNSLANTDTTSSQETQKLIYTANVTLETTDYQKSVDALHSLMTSCNAFAENEDEWTRGDGDLHTLEITLRVPSERYDELMEGMDGIEGKVINRSSQVTNITREYADNEAVIEGLEIQEERLLEMMEQAETIEDMILVEERLSEVQILLNRARTSRETMDSEVNLSTVTVTITEVRFETTTSETGYLTRVGNAFVDMWEGLVEGLGDFGIGLIYAIPAIVILLVIILLVRRAIRKSRAKQAEQAAQTGQVTQGVAPGAPATQTIPPAAPEDTGNPSTEA